MRAVSYPDMIPLYTSAGVSASSHYTCLQAFGGIRTCYADEDWLASTVVFTTKNSSLLVINNLVGDLIPSPYRNFLSADTIADEMRDALH